MEPVEIPEVMRQRLIAQLRRAAQALTDGQMSAAESLAIVRACVAAVAADVEVMRPLPSIY